MGKYSNRFKLKAASTIVICAIILRNSNAKQASGDRYALTVMTFKINFIQNFPKPTLLDGSLCLLNEINLLLLLPSSSNKYIERKNYYFIPKVSYILLRKKKILSCFKQTHETFSELVP